MNSLHFLSVVVLVLCTCFLLRKPRRRTPNQKLPPGPPPLPIIGNLLQLGQLPHRSLAKLAQTYGPLMSLHLGSIYTVVISSADVAKEVLTKHDQAFSSRMIPTAARAYDHYKLSFAFLPAEAEWRRIRRLCKEHLFSIACLEATQELRQDKVQKLCHYVQKCCDANRAVDVAHAAYMTTLNLLLATLFSEELAGIDSGTAQEFKSLAEEILNVTGDINIAEFLPFLQWIDPQRVKKRSELYFGRMLAFIQGLIDQRLRLKETSPDSPKKSDFLETLLDLAKGTEYNYTVNDIAHILLEFVTAGAGTTSTTTEWAMTELLLHPETLSKAKQELRDVIGEDRQVQESDISRLPYFQAVIKEVLRYHAPGTFLIPRKSVSVVEINGYTIPKGTQVLVNTWAIGRDPKTWSNPDLFQPERFFDAKIDFKGQDFELIPFGAGRRICPGLSLGSRMVHMMVASLIHNFDWKIESSLKPGEVEMEEKFALSVRKEVPLRAIPIKMA